MELATVSALGQTNAVFIVLIAIIFYHEKVGVWRWGAIAVGFTGALLIVRPGSDVFTWTALMPIGAAFCYAASMVTLRSFDKSVSSAILYLYSASAAAFGAILLARARGHSGFPLGLISVSNFQNGGLNERATVCGIGRLVAAA